MNSGPIIHAAYVICDVVTNDDSLSAFKRWLSGSRSVLAIDTETGTKTRNAAGEKLDNARWWEDPMRLLTVGDSVSRPWVIPAQWAPDVWTVLARYKRPIAMHNAKFDLHVIERAGAKLNIANVSDTMLMAFALHPDERKGLKFQGQKIDPLADGLDTIRDQLFKRRGWDWATIPSDNEVYWAYAALDAYLTAHLYDRYWPLIESGPRARRVYDLDWSVSLILKRMEERATLIDRDYCLTARDEMLEECRAEADAIRSEYGIDAGSGMQLAEVLEREGAALNKRTEKTGRYSMATDALEKINHPLAARVVKLRHNLKFAQAYFGGMLTNAGESDLLHPSINAVGARTGRMSVNDPPMQQLPRSKRVRDAVIPRPGNRLVLADFRQVEYRILASDSGDTAMLEAIAYGDRMAAEGREGYDLHTMNARLVYGLDLDAPVTKDQRSRAKGGGFARVYGAGAARFAVTAGCSIDEARAFLTRFDDTFPGVADYSRRVQKRARQRWNKEGEAYVRTHTGRRIVLHPTLAESGQFYPVTNYRIQGNAADVFKEALVRLDAAGLGEFMILPVHDEVVSDVPEKMVDDVTESIRRHMPDQESFRVPLLVDVTDVARWGERYED